MRQWIFALTLSVTAGLCYGNCGGNTTNRGLSQTEASRTPVARPPAEADSRPLILAFGDSLTAGLGVDSTDNYPAKLQQRIDSAGYRYRVINGGVSGDTTAQGLSRARAIRDSHPSIVILELGANDGLRGVPVEETRKNLDEIIRTLRTDGAVVVLAAMRLPPNYGPEYTRSFEATYRELAKKHGLRLIPFFLEGVGGHPELNQDDGIHPTPKGYDVVTENVWTVLRPLLE